MYDIMRLQEIIGQFSGATDSSHHIAEVRGSSPLLPTTSHQNSEELSIRELLIMLLGPEARRRLELRSLSNGELFGK
jgi:hypothetical protein